MAKLLPFDDSFGNHYDDSYWRIAQVNIGVADHTAYVVAYGYRDAAARQAGKQAIGSKSYTVSGDAFDALYAMHVAPNGPNLLTLVYTQVLDVDPFFEGAADA